MTHHDVDDNVHLQTESGVLDGVDAEYARFQMDSGAGCSPHKIPCLAYCVDPLSQLVDLIV